MKIHWHFDNPWRQKAVYVPLPLLVPINHQRFSDFGDKVDAYLLEQPDGSILAGIRYGEKPEQYLALSPMILGNTRALLEENRMQWRPCRWDDVETRPTLAGVYMFRIAGDSETDGPHVYYEYPDYTQSGRVIIEKGEDEVFAYGDTDEEPESIIAWYGPLTAPPCDCY